MWAVAPKGGGGELDVTERENYLYRLSDIIRRVK
jgi:hypothetical protein